MSAAFKAVVVTRANDSFSVELRHMRLDELPPGEVLIRVAYSALNYKDALVCSPAGRVAQTSPLVPGLELTGTVVESSDPRVRVGERVIANDFGQSLGVSRHGGFSEYARVPGDFVTELRAAQSFRQAHVLSGGIAALIGVNEIEHAGVSPDKGPILVTGATGAVGSLAIRLLGQRGYQVVASTGKTDAADYLKRLGATKIVTRAETSAESPRPLGAECWAGGIDSVGGSTLAYMLRTTMRGGAIAAIGLAGGAAFQTTVFPFIVRGVKLLGVDMPSASLADRRRLWEQINHEACLADLDDSIISEIALDDVPSSAQALLQGQLRGRVLVKVS